MDDGRNHRDVRASADPDSDAFGFDLDASGIATVSPDFRLGLALDCFAFMANSHGRYHSVHRRYKRRIQAGGTLMDIARTFAVSHTTIARLRAKASL